MGVAVVGSIAVASGDLLEPGEIVGTETLEQSGDDVVQTIDIAVTVSMPFVGGKVEDLIAGFVGRVFEAENKVGVKWLAGDWRV